MTDKKKSAPKKTSAKKKETGAPEKDAPQTPKAEKLIPTLIIRGHSKVSFHVGKVYNLTPLQRKAMEKLGIASDPK